MSLGTGVFLMFATFIAGGVLIVVSGMRHRGRVLEMAHRERLAMIERGMVPSADLLASGYGELEQRRRTRSTRLLSGGIMTVGLGLGVAMLLAFASREPEIAAGVGGAIVMLGLAFMLTAYVSGGPRNPSDSPS